MAVAKEIVQYHIPQVISNYKKRSKFYLFHKIFPRTFPYTDIVFQYTDRHFGISVHIDLGQK